MGNVIIIILKIYQNQQINISKKVKDVYNENFKILGGEGHLKIKKSSYAPRTG